MVRLMDTFKNSRAAMMIVATLIVVLGSQMSALACDAYKTYEDKDGAKWFCKLQYAVGEDKCFYSCIRYGQEQQEGDNSEAN